MAIISLLAAALLAPATALHLAPRLAPRGRLPSVRMSSYEEVQEAASAAAAALGDAAGTVSDAAQVAVPVVGTAASIAGSVVGTAASIGFEVTKKTVEVAAPVVGEGVKAAVPLAAGGIRAIGGALDPTKPFDAPVEPVNVDVGALVSSPFAGALANAAPWALLAVVAYFGGQFLLLKVKETVGPLVYPAIGLVGLGGALFWWLSYGDGLALLS